MASCGRCKSLCFAGVCAHERCTAFSCSDVAQGRGLTIRSRPAEFPVASRGSAWPVMQATICSDLDRAIQVGFVRLPMSLRLVGIFPRSTSLSGMLGTAGSGLIRNYATAWS